MNSIYMILKAFIHLQKKFTKNWEVVLEAQVKPFTPSLQKVHFM